jgi:hypothetical protein
MELRERGWNSLGDASTLRDRADIPAGDRVVQVARLDDDDRVGRRSIDRGAEH